MDRYETVIHIITEGKDAVDAGERAGRLLDLKRAFEEVVVSCEPTYSINCRKENGQRDRKYETTIHIITEGEDEFDAGEAAGELLDTKKIFEEAIVSCEPTRPVMLEEKREENASWHEKYLLRQ